MIPRYCSPRSDPRLEHVTVASSPQEIEVGGIRIDPAAKCLPAINWRLLSVICGVSNASIAVVRRDSVRDGLKASRIEVNSIWSRLKALRNDPRANQIGSQADRIDAGGHRIRHAHLPSWP